MRRGREVVPPQLTVVMATIAEAGREISLKRRVQKKLNQASRMMSDYIQVRFGEFNEFIEAQHGLVNRVLRFKILLDRAATRLHGLRISGIVDPIHLQIELGAILALLDEGRQEEIALAQEVTLRDIGGQG